MLDPVPTGVGVGQELFARKEQVRTVEIESCGSKLPVPTSGSALELWI